MKSEINVNTVWCQINTQEGGSGLKVEVKLSQ